MSLALWLARVSEALGDKKGAEDLYGTAIDLGDVVKMTVFLTDDNNRAAINKYWNECWPDPHKRPARHSLVLPLRGGVLLQLEVLAVAKDAK